MIVVIPWFVPVDRLEIDSAFGGKRIVVTMWLLARRISFSGADLHRRGRKARLGERAGLRAALQISLVRRDHGSGSGAPGRRL